MLSDDTHQLPEVFMPRRLVALVPVLACVIVLAGALGACQKAKGGADSTAGSGPSFALEVKAPPDGTVGAPAVTQVLVTPQGSWHINVEYPVSLDVTAPADVELAKNPMARDDAARFDAGGLRFDVTATPRGAGAKSFQAKLKFGVCIEARCEMKRETLAWTLNVK